MSLGRLRFNQIRKFTPSLNLLNDALRTAVMNDIKIGQSIEEWSTQTDKEYLLGCYFPDGKRFAGITIVKGEGNYLYDSEGVKYLDFMSGIAVSSLGHSDKGWAQVVSDQAYTLVHTSNLYHTLPQLMLAKRLIQLSPDFSKVFLCNSGCEANEAALKFARRYAAMAEGVPEGKPAIKKRKFISFKNCFHGRTMGALTVTYKPAIREPFGPEIPGTVFLDFNDKEVLKDAFDDDVAAVIIEPIQGEGGIEFPNNDFLMKLKELCEKHNSLLIADEVQCGLGRTGSLWAHKMWDIQPDIMTLAKPLAAGLPIGAVLMKEKVAMTIRPGDHGTTFGGNPLVCAAAYHTLNRIAEPKFLSNIQETGISLIEHMHELKTNELKDHLGEIRWPGGLMMGIDVIPPVREVIEKCAKEGLLIISAGKNTVRIVPPLTITKTEVEEFVKIFKKVLLTFKL